MRWLGRALVVLLFLGLGIPVVAWRLMRSEKPEVPLTAAGDHEHALRLRALLKKLGDPRRRQVGELIQVEMVAADVEALAIEATRRLSGLGVHATLGSSAAILHLSAVSPWPELSPYLNVRATVRGSPEAPELSDVQVGALPVPRVIAQALFDQGYHRYARASGRARAALEAVETFELGEGQLRVRFRWTEPLAHELRGVGRFAMLGELSTERVRDYRDGLARVLSATRSERPLPLRTILPLYFALVKARAGDDVQRELQAAVLVLTFHAVGIPLNDLLGVEFPAVPPRELTLWNRGDLAKHYLVSFLLVTWGDRSFADAVGLSKEVTDSQGGSGFSFADLAADRAGTEHAERAFASPALARKLIDRWAEPLAADADLMPDPRRLPEGLSEQAFSRVYEAVGSERYRSLLEYIDAGIRATAVTRALGG